MAVRNAIEIRGLTKRYGSLTAIENITFEVRRGELFGLIGPDGAGKTTLFRLLATLLNPDDGVATVDGFDIVGQYKEIRKRVGYMPGRFSLYPDLSVEENLEFFAALFGVGVKDNYDLIAPIYTQIEPFRKRRAGKLSGGMKQKLALCCALIHRPSVLFLDEPTTGVDAVSRSEFWDMLSELKSKGISILVSTPYMDEACRCDRIALCNNGKILGIDTPAGITARFDEPLYALSGDNMYGLLVEARRIKGVKECYPFGESHHLVADSMFDSDEFTAHLNGQGFHNVSIRPVEPGIEDVFIKLMHIIISVRDLCKCFGDFVAVDHITFNVKRGEIFGFLGANGAGKTTAMRMLCGLSYPTSGRGMVAGYDVMTQGEEIKKHIGYMSQKFSLYDDLTVRENIRLYAGIYGLSRYQMLRRTVEMLNRLHFRSEIDTLVGSLPLGWKQKLAFSIATLHRPEVVFLDEPTGGVDPVTRRQFWEMIYEAASGGTTVFVTTHYMDEAEYCSRVSIMVDGKVKALGSPAELKKQYAVGSMDEVFRTLARSAKRGE